MRIVAGRFPPIGPDTREIGRGPVDFNVDQARKMGASEQLIASTWSKLSAIASQFYADTHAAGPVKACECVACDPRIEDRELPAEYLETRRRWARRASDLRRQHREAERRASAVPSRRSPPGRVRSGAAAPPGAAPRGAAARRARGDRRRALAARPGRAARLLRHGVRAVIAGVCRVCGCTDSRPCVLDPEGETVAIDDGSTTMPLGFTTCSWIEPDLCSGCVEDAAPPLLYDAEGNPIGRAP